MSTVRLPSRILIRSWLSKRTTYFSVSDGHGRVWRVCEWKGHVRLSKKWPRRLWEVESQKEIDTLVRSGSLFSLHSSRIPSSRGPSSGVGHWVLTTTYLWDRGHGDLPPGETLHEEECQQVCESPSRSGTGVFTGRRIVWDVIEGGETTELRGTEIYMKGLSGGLDWWAWL